MLTVTAENCILALLEDGKTGDYTSLNVDCTFDDGIRYLEKYVSNDEKTLTIFKWNFGYEWKIQTKKPRPKFWTAWLLQSKRSGKALLMLSLFRTGRGVAA